jgi:hypothetical protein
MRFKRDVAGLVGLGTLSESCRNVSVRVRGHSEALDDDGDDINIT